MDADWISIITLIVSCLVLYNCSGRDEQKRLEAAVNVLQQKIDQLERNVNGANDYLASEIDSMRHEIKHLTQGAPIDRE